jgi:hypothetical protein
MRYYITNQRPRVDIKKNNIVPELMEILTKHLPYFMAYQGLAGIMLDGGLSRGYADHLSEIDIVLFLHEAQYTQYQHSTTPIALGITVMDGYLYDIKLLNYEQEMKKNYDPVALWDLSYAKILYDPMGELKLLFEQKLSEKIDLSAAAGFMFEAWWNYKLAGDIWIYREDALQGHYILGNALKPLISALFIANEEYIPHEKWLIHMSRSLPWLPDNYELLLLKAISTGDLTTECVINRQHALHELWISIDKRLCELTDFSQNIHFMQKHIYETLKWASQKGSFPLQEWEKEHSPAELNREPFHSLLLLEKGMLYYNEQKARKLTDSDLYEWFYQIANAVNLSSGK